MNATIVRSWNRRGEEVTEYQEDITGERIFRFHLKEDVPGFDEEREISPAFAAAWLNLHGIHLPATLRDYHMTCQERAWLEQPEALEEPWPEILQTACDFREHEIWRALNLTSIGHEGPPNDRFLRCRGRDVQVVYQKKTNGFCHITQITPLNRGSAAVRDFFQKLLRSPQTA